MPQDAATDSAGQNRTEPRSPAIWEQAFLRVMRKTGIVSDACKAAKVARSTVYEHRDTDLDFKALWDDARQEAADWLEKEAWRRAMDGWLEPVFQKGELVGHVRRYSDQLLTRLLEANNPKKFKHRTDVTSNDEKLAAPIVYLPEIQDEP